MQPVQSQSMIVYASSTETCAPRATIAVLPPPLILTLPIVTPAPETFGGAVGHSKASGETASGTGASGTLLASASAASRDGDPAAASGVVPPPNGSNAHPTQTTRASARNTTRLILPDSVGA